MGEPLPEKRVYHLPIVFNGRQFERVVISDHYQQRHQATMNDEIVLELVKRLDGERQPASDVAPDGYRYYSLDNVVYQGKPYRIVVTDHPLENFLGVVNAFRRPYVERD